MKALLTYYVVEFPQADSLKGGKVLWKVSSENPDVSAEDAKLQRFLNPDKTYRVVGLPEWASWLQHAVANQFLEAAIEDFFRNPLTPTETVV